MGETDYPIFEEKTTVIDTDAMVQDATALKEFLARMTQGTPEGEIAGIATLALTGFSRKYGFGSDGIFSMTVQRSKLPLELSMQEELGHGELAVLDAADIVSSNTIGYIEEDNNGIPTRLGEQQVALMVRTSSRLNPGEPAVLLIPVDAIVHMEKFEGLA
jgi:hypothetical protein